MEDIFIDDRRQVSARAKNRKEDNKKSPKRSFRQYIVDLFIKGLMCASVIAINFILFAKSGSYSMFTGFQTINPEALYLLIALTSLVFLINFLLSFSKVLQNVWVAVVIAFFTTAILNQFALFDKGTILAGKYGDYLPQEFVSYLSYNSHIVIIIAVAIFSFLFMSFAGRMTQFYLLGIFLFILGWNLGTGYFYPINSNFKTVYNNPDEDIVSQNKNDEKRLVYLTFSGLTSYENMKKLSPADSNKKTNAAEIMLGFYTQNNFKLFANAYNNNGNPFENAVSALNFASTDEKADNFILSNVILHSHWDFDNLHSPTLYLKSNKLFRSLKKEDYQIHIYETHKLESCYINNEIVANKCVRKKNIPFNMDGTQLTTVQKTILLFDQWLESTGIIEDTCIINDVLKLVLSSQDFPLDNFSSLQLSVINSFKSLDIIARDIERDEGKNAYFALIELPADAYVYDSMCKLKPVSQWITADSTNAARKKESYAEQVACLYGQLENFIAKLSNNNKLANTTIVIQGLNTPQRLLPMAPTTDFAQNIENKTLTLAIHTAQSDKPSIDYAICPINSFLQNAFNNTPLCSSFENINLDKKAKEEAVKAFEEKQISAKTVEQSLAGFIQWYQNWAEANGAENNLKNLLPTEQEAETKTEAPSENEVKEVTEAKVAEEIDELPSEAETKTIEEVSDTQDTEETSENEPKEVQPQVQPQINIETKVIDLKENTEAPKEAEAK